MGRKPSVHLSLPPGMRVRRKPSGRTYYYLETTVGKKRELTALGTDYVEALRKYAELVITAPAPAVTVPELLRTWNAETAPGRPKGTLDDIRWSLPHLNEFFSTPEPAPLDQVEPVHITQYLAWRIKRAKQIKAEANERRAEDGKPPLVIKHNEGAVRANREIAWLSAAWNWGRSNGVTKALNPCDGVKRNREAGRDVYIEDDELAAIIAHACAPLAEALELAYLVGQRPGDLRDFRETDIRDGFLHVEQAKTGTRQRIEVAGKLADLIDRIRARKASIKGVRSLSLIVNERGESLGKSALRYRFDKAREAAANDSPNAKAAARIRSLQFRDLRAKAATDKADLQDLAQAQALLGHTRQDMTEHYVRKRKGAKVTAVK